MKAVNVKTDYSVDTRVKIIDSNIGILVWIHVWIQVVLVQLNPARVFPTLLSVYIYTCDFFSRGANEPLSEMSEQ